MRHTAFTRIHIENAMCTHVEHYDNGNDDDDGALMTNFTFCVYCIFICLLSFFVDFTIYYLIVGYFYRANAFASAYIVMYFD